MKLKNKGFKNQSKTSIILWTNVIGGEWVSSQDKIVKFKKRKNINIGFVVFFILFIYIVINIILSLTKDQLTIYEVLEGSTAVDNRTTALILRKEELINSDSAGYVLYYQKDGARIAKKSTVYSMTDSEIYNSDINDGQAILLSSKNDTEIRHEIRTFQNTYSDDDFSSVYDFKDSAKSTILDLLNSSLVQDEKDAISGGVAYRSKQSGIITYYKDNFETVTADTVTSDMFDRNKYNKTSLRTIQKITKDTPVYKIITSEEWNLILPLTKEQYSRLKDKKKVSLTILEDKINIKADLELTKVGSDNYAILTMYKDMANYLSERYLDVQIDFDSASGLKIPNTAIVKKKFYKVPSSYFTKGGNSKETGLNKEVYGKDGEVSYSFVPTDIYFEENNYAYIDAELFKAGTVILSPQPDSKQHTLSKTVKLTGVYNVNQGYAVFKRIEIQSKGEEYSIIKDNTVKGLSAYDHIVLVGKTAIEQKIIY